MGYRYMRCPYCGQSDRNDDKILSNTMIQSYNGSDVTVIEERKCDICEKKYEVKMFYTLEYEELLG